MAFHVQLTWLNKIPIIMVMLQEGMAPESLKPAWTRTNFNSMIKVKENRVKAIKWDILRIFQGINDNGKYTNKWLREVWLHRMDSLFSHQIELIIKILPAPILVWTFSMAITPNKSQLTNNQTLIFQVLLGKVIQQVDKDL